MSGASLDSIRLIIQRMCVHYLIIIDPDLFVQTVTLVQKLNLCDEWTSNTSPEKIKVIFLFAELLILTFVLKVRRNEVVTIVKKIRY